MRSSLARTLRQSLPIESGKIRRTGPAPRRRGGTSPGPRPATAPGQRSKGPQEYQEKATPGQAARPGGLAVQRPCAAV